MDYTLHADHQYTTVFVGVIEGTGVVIVAISGKHDIEAEGFTPLDHKRFPMRVHEDGRLSPIEDISTAEAFMCLATSYFYMNYGGIVTSTAQIVERNNGVFLLELNDFGVVEITPVGIIEVPDLDGISNDTYQLAIANPKPGVYLVVILEVIDTSPLDVREIDLDDDDLIDAIITEYLELIGAIDPVDEEADAVNDEYEH